MNSLASDEYYAVSLIPVDEAADNRELFTWLSFFKNTTLCILNALVVKEMIQRPGTDEYGSFYEDYINHVEGQEVISTLVQQGQTMVTLFQRLSPEQAAHRYAEGKWSVRQVIGHLIDTERIMSYRALCISRGETASLPGYDQDDYVENANFEQRDLQNMSAEYDALRNATVSMFNGFEPEQLIRKGTANDTILSVRAIAYIIAGHERRHMNFLDKKYDIDFNH